MIGIGTLQRRRAIALMTTCLTSLPFAALAADNAVIVTPGSGVTMRSKDIGGGVQSMITIPGDTSGNALASAPGTPNASFALPVQGVTGGSPIPANVTQFGGTNIVTGTGASAAGVPRVTVSSDSTLATNTTLLGGTATVGAVSSIVNQVTTNMAQFGGTNVVTGGTNGAVGVGGLANSGAAVVGNPVRVGGELGTGNVGEASTSTWGSAPTALTVFGVNANILAGTVAVTQATSSNLLGKVDPITIATWGLAAIAPGTAPTNMQVAGGVFNSTAPTLTNGQTAALQQDASGFLKVNVVAGSTGNAAAGSTGSAVPASADYQGVNVNGTLRGVLGVTVGSNYDMAVDLTSSGGVTLAALSAYGTAPVGNVLGVNANVTNANSNGQSSMAGSSPVVIASNQSNLPVTEENGNAYPNASNFKSNYGHATATAAFTILPAGAAKLYVTGVQCSRSDTGTLAITAALNDPSTLTFAVPNAGAGGGNNLIFQTPIVMASTTALTVTSSATLAGGTLYCAAQAYNAS
jgi:hypothetical protein